MIYRRAGSACVVGASAPYNHGAYPLRVLPAASGELCIAIRLSHQKALHSHLTKLANDAN